jgi:L-ascorbate metabolism protein UlaG (beta-lactamase superfamily)
MSRTLSILAGLLLFAAPAVAADGPKATVIRWHGQSFFEIVSKDGVRIVLDPHAIPAFGRKLVTADLVLCSHHHTDHTRLEVVDNIKDLQKAKRVFIGTEEKDLKPKYIDIKGEYKGVKFYNVRLFHDDVEGMKRGLNTALVIEVDGLRIVHLGDLGHRLTEQQKKKIGKADVLMIPVGGVYTINGLDALKIIKEDLTPTRYVLPMHYGVPGFGDLLDIEKYFLEEVDDVRSIKRSPLTNELRINSEDKPPAKPIIAVLHWEKKGEKSEN